VKRSRTLLALACLGSLLAAQTAAAQNLVIANARIIVGTGQVIERGSLVVRGDRIASVTAGPAPSSARGARIDAGGMTLIAGYIDTHRHLIQAGRDRAGKTVDQFLKDSAPTAMRELLESGVTTVQSGGDDNAGILRLKQMVDSGQIKGPRIISSAGVPTARMKDEAQVRAAVDAAKAAGADSIAEVWYPSAPWPFAPTEQETRNLAAGVEEARKMGIPFQIHAVSPPAMIAAVRFGGRRFIHSMHYDWMTDAEAKEVAAAGAMVASSTANPTPVFDIFNHDNKPTYRDGAAWPAGELGLGEDRGRSSGFMPVNGRTLFDNGVNFAYSSDTDYNATAGLAQELKTLNLVFSPLDLIKIIGPNSAAFVDHAADRGTLQAGKLADILILTGNPVDGYWNFLKPVVVIKGGQIVVDKRAQLRTVKTL
jgi:imidazolonepropionase-like amidohydrolase